MSEEIPKSDAVPPATDAAAPKMPRSERREKAAADVLRTFIRDLQFDRFGDPPKPGSNEKELVLRLKVNPDKNWELQFEPSLSDQVAQQLEEAAAERDVYRKGHVFCYRCESADCEHSVPPTSQSVFGSYAPNGIPEWMELAQVLIAAKDERVDQLFDRHARNVVALVQFGHDLKTRQLSSFGKSSKTYSVLGQVIAGYFPLKQESGKSLAEPLRVAVTFQAVEVRDSTGALRVRLNAMAGLPEGQSLQDLFASGWQPGLLRAYELTNHLIDAIEWRAAAARTRGDADELGSAMRQVPGALRRLSDSIERGIRQEGRRTRHVEERRHEQRPVHKALDDAKLITPEKLFFDEKTSAFVACGDQGRAHVFSPEGKHITSFILHPGAVDFRLRTKRWRLATEEEFTSFNGKLGTI
jgi:hypothetical protein